MPTLSTNSREEIGWAKIDETDWAGLSTLERIRLIELEGYIVIPNLLPVNLVEKIKNELSRLPTTATDYSTHQRGYSEIQWTESPHSIGVIALSAMTDFLSTLLGDELICTSCAFSLSQPGHPGIAIHTDAQPYGSKIFGVQSSSPCLVRALYYLDDLTPECSPLKVIPRSHLSLHTDAIPYKRYLSLEGEVMVTCKAGSAAVINQKIFHGNYPNYSDRDRRMLAIAYRPTWAGPIAEVPDWDAEKVAKLPPGVRKYFRSLNTRSIDFDVPNRPSAMATHAPGISPSRWKAVGG